MDNNHTESKANKEKISRRVKNNSYRAGGDKKNADYTMMDVNAPECQRIIPDPSAEHRMEKKSQFKQNGSETSCQKAGYKRLME